MKFLIPIFFVGLLQYPLLGQQPQQLIYDSTRVYQQSFIDSILQSPRLSPNDSRKAYKKILESNKNLTGWSYYYLMESTFFYRNEVFDSSLHYANKAIESFPTTTNSNNFEGKLMIQAFLNKAAVFRILEDYTNSIAAYQNALKLTDKYEYKWKGYLISGIGENHFYLGNDSLALHYKLLASKDSLSMSVPRFAVNIFSTIGVLYDNIGELDSAKVYLLKVVDYCKQKNYSEPLSSLYIHLARIVDSVGNNSEVLAYQNKAITAFDKYGYGGVGDSHTPSFITLYKAQREIEKGNINKIIPEIREVIKEKSNLIKIDKLDKAVVTLGYQTLTQAYSSLGDTQYSEKLLRANTNFLDKYYQKITALEVQKLEIQYETQKKEELINQLEKNKEQQATIFRQQSIILWIILIVTFIALVISYLFYNKNKKEDELIKDSLNQKLLILQMSPHFVFNSLSSIVALVEKKSSNTIGYIHNLASLFRSVLSSSSQEFISLKEELSTTKNYLELQKINTQNEFSYSINIHSETNADFIIIPSMLIQPLVENAIKHGIAKIQKAGKIEINVFEKVTNKLIHFEIKDNGQGLFKEKIARAKSLNNKSSFALQIIKSRLSLYKKKFKVNSQLVINNNTKKGTVCNIFLPYFIE